MCLLDYIYSVVDLYLELRYILYTYAYTHNVQHVWLMHQRVARFVEAEYQQLSTAQLKDEAGVSWPTKEKRLLYPGGCPKMGVYPLIIFHIPSCKRLHHYGKIHYF